MVLKRTEQTQYKTKVLDHLGLVAGMSAELNIASIIDQQIPSESPDKILSTGTAIVGLILNGLGFVNKRLYLVSRFFKNKPVSKLLNVSYLTSDHFNDDALGRALDAVYEFGVSKLYSIISHQAVEYLSEHYGLQTGSGQLDITNFHLHGNAKSLEMQDEQRLEIVQGYSKDHRPDLVQVGLELIVENKSRIPLLMKVLSGNEEESKSYGNFIEEYSNQLTTDYGMRLVVVDSKLYNLENIALLKQQTGLNWLTRVPNGLKITKTVLSSMNRDEMEVLEGYPAYKYQVIYTDYGSVWQRWLVLYNADKYERDLTQLHKRMLQQTEAAYKAYKKLTKKEFASAKEALVAAEQFSKKLKFNDLKNIEVVAKNHYQRPGKPKKGQQPDRVSYHIQADLSSDLEAYEAEKQRLGYFILATNDGDEILMPPKELLAQYKNQSGVEGAFRFLKDPNIVASSLFVQKPQRIMAIIMVMTLCLLVYSALEYKTRTLLEQKELTFPSRLGKPIQNPTMRWIFECFEGIHILYTPEQQELILNMDEQQKFILQLLGNNYWKYYT